MEGNPIAELEAFAEPQYRGTNHNRLMTVVVKTLADAGIPCTFENIVVASYRLFPSVFALEGYPQYPDAARINRTLLHCKPKYEDYIATSGQGARGLFYLTPRGTEAARETVEVLRGSGSVVKGRAKTPRSVHEQIVSDVKKSEAFTAWLSGVELSETDAFTVLHLLPGAKPNAINENLEIIQKSAAVIDDQRVNDFLSALRAHFDERN